MARKRPIVMLNPADHPVGTRLLWTLMAGRSDVHGPVMEHPHELTISEWSPDGRVCGWTPFSAPPRPAWYGLDTVEMMGVLEVLPPTLRPTVPRETRPDERKVHDLEIPG